MRARTTAGEGISTDLGLDMNERVMRTDKWINTVPKGKESLQVEAVVDYRAHIAGDRESVFGITRDISCFLNEVFCGRPKCSFLVVDVSTTCGARCRTRSYDFSH